jgi:hypothetical protein
MDSVEKDQLLTEYQVNVDLWKHDDDLRQQRNGTFLTINSLLLVALGALITFSPASVFVILITAFFGFPICLIWYYVQRRNAEYIRFRRYQLRSIEAQLPVLTTFTNQWKGLNQYQAVSFKGIEDTFNITAEAKRSTTWLEGYLPLFIAIFWLLVFLLSLLVIVGRLFS